MRYSVLTFFAQDDHVYPNLIIHDYSPLSGNFNLRMVLNIPASLAFVFAKYGSF